MLEPKLIAEAVERLGCLAMFPAQPAARTEIMRLIDRMVSTPEQLEWLVRTMVDHVGQWHGTKELRAVFCTRWRPADGKEEYSALPGFTAGDIEAEKPVGQRFMPVSTEYRKALTQLALRKRLQ